MKKLVCMLLLMAGLPALAQEPAGKFSYSGKDVPLQKLLDSIKNAAGMKLASAAGYWMRNTRPVTIRMKNGTIREALETCFKDQQLKYAFDKDWIVVTQRNINGIVVDADGEPVAGITISLKGTKRDTLTDINGQFSLSSSDTLAIIELSGVNIEYMAVAVYNRWPLEIKVKPKVASLIEVQVKANTGYQVITPDRSTGSYSSIDTQQLQQPVTTDILKRLHGRYPGLFSYPNARQTANEPEFSIRGTSTLSANRAPLVVIDDFPYFGLDNSTVTINPNDVESVTILKDASAASIWGARAANGVIVITTKKGKSQRKPVFTFSSSITLEQKPDAYDFPQLSVADYIEVQKYLYSNYHYAGWEYLSFHPPLSPVVEMLKERESGKLTDTDTTRMLNEWRAQDVRRNINRYVYQRPLNQQYAANLSGSTEKVSYYFGTGYDVNRQMLQDFYNSRVTLYSNTTYRPIPDLSITANIYLQLSQATAKGGVPYSPYPYTAWVDADGNAATAEYFHRQLYIDTATRNYLDDWSYRPLEERQLVTDKTKLLVWRVNGAAKYSLTKLVKGLSIGAQQSLSVNSGNQQTWYNPRSYYARNLQNRFTTIDGNSVMRNVPAGGIQDNTDREIKTFQVRLRADYERNWKNHSLTALAGWEITDSKYNGNSWRLYGYQPNTGTDIPVDYNKPFPLFYDPYAMENIPGKGLISYATDRYISLFANAAWRWKRYVLSVSGRKDESNIFGVSTNSKGRPFFSSGIKWNVANEPFYHNKWLTGLVLRVTYGTNGNVYKGAAAKTTVSIDGLNPYGLPAGSINNPANEELSWEQANLLNIGADIKTHNNVLTGSIDFYWRKSSRLIGVIPVDITTGNTAYSGNTGRLKGHGFDLTLTTKNIDRKLKWYTNLLIGYSTNKVLTSAADSLAAWQLCDPHLSNAIAGKLVNALFSLKSAGLSPLTGDPRGYWNGQVSTQYDDIIKNTPVTELVYHGSSRPLAAGTLRNTLGFKQWQLMIAVTGNFGYYVRVPSINYGDLFSEIDWGHPDFARRWQKPGDEKITQVPSMIYPVTEGRNMFYKYSGALVTRGDHLRLKEVYASYEWKCDNRKLPFRSMVIYGYASNLGILWKATHLKIDPDYIGFAPERSTFSLGIRTEF